MNTQPRTRKGNYYRTWTPEEEQLLRDKWPTHTQRQLHKMLPGHSPHAIRLMALRLGMHKRKKNQRVIAYETSGIREFSSVRAAAEHYGITEAYVYNLIRTGNETKDGISIDYLTS